MPNSVKPYELPIYPHQPMYRPDPIPPPAYMYHDIAIQQPHSSTAYYSSSQASDSIANYPYPNTTPYSNITSQQITRVPLTPQQQANNDPNDMEGARVLMEMLSKMSGETLKSDQNEERTALQSTPSLPQYFPQITPIQSTYQTPQQLSTTPSEEIVLKKDDSTIRCCVGGCSCAESVCVCILADGACNVSNSSRHHNHIDDNKNDDMMSDVSVQNDGNVAKKTFSGDEDVGYDTITQSEATTNSMKAKSCCSTPSSLSGCCKESHKLEAADSKTTVLTRDCTCGCYKTGSECPDCAKNDCDLYFSGGAETQQFVEEVRNAMRSQSVDKVQQGCCCNHNDNESACGVDVDYCSCCRNNDGCIDVGAGVAKSCCS